MKASMGWQCAKKKNANATIFVSKKLIDFNVKINS